MILIHIQEENVLYLQVSNKSNSNMLVIINANINLNFPEKYLNNVPKNFLEEEEVYMNHYDTPLYSHL